jgi:hypothetical protein
MEWRGIWNEPHGKLDIFTSFFYQKRRTVSSLPSTSSPVANNTIWTEYGHKNLYTQFMQFTQQSPHAINDGIVSWKTFSVLKWQC